MTLLRRRMSSRSRNDLIASILTVIVLTMGAIVIMIPFFWMITTSLKRAGDVYISPPQWIPAEPQFVNYMTAITRLNFGVHASNTFMIVVLVMIGTLFSASFAAYGFARLNAPGRDFIFMILLGTLMLPWAVTMVPTYLMFNAMGWVNTFLPLIVPAFFGNAFYVFLMRQFYITIPRELEESAMIDGATIYQIWWYIMLPLSGPVLATIAVFTFVATYNDFFTPLIYLNDESKRTIAVALTYFQGSPRIGPQMHLLMAAVSMSIVPPIILFILAQRYFVRGIAMTGIKG
ncbi:MAG: carbohydrate ABC transporter permease [Roseiflexaceae bacterium]|jgi:multiple sugar transport system permease protein|nr:carbohydrate ABC transporter permease [Chloroflexaceae bacterium]